MIKKYLLVCCVVLLNNFALEQSTKLLEIENFNKQQICNNMVQQIKECNNLPTTEQPEVFRQLHTKINNSSFSQQEKNNLFNQLFYYKLLVGFYAVKVDTNN